VVQGLIALALGSILALLPAAWVLWTTAAVFLFFGIKLLITDEEKQETEISPSKHRIVLTTFLMVTAAEWGDASQIGTAALVAHLHAPVQVVIGATLGLWTGAALAVGVGRVIGTRIPGHWLRRSAGVLFCVFAVFSILHR
jgi:putative Ca2+/H+ antiporter (TMEM165/GDT1 family)